MLMFVCTTLIGLTACSQEEAQSLDPNLNKNAISKAAITANVPLNYTPAIYLSLYDGTSSENPYWKCTDYILVDRISSAEYKAVYGVKDNAGGQVVFWYDANYKFIKADCSKFTTEFVTPENAEYIRVNQHVQYPADVPLYILRYNESDDKEMVSLSYTGAVYIDYYTGIPTENPFWKCSQSINVQPDDAFYIEDNGGGQVLFWYSATGQFIKLDESKTKATFKAPANAATLIINQHVQYADVNLYRVLPTKNLIRAYLFCRGIDENGVVSDVENCYWKYTDYIPVTGGTQYDMPSIRGGQTVFWYENAPIPRFIKREFIFSETTLMAPANAGFIRVLQHVEYPDAPLYKKY